MYLFDEICQDMNVKAAFGPSLNLISDKLASRKQQQQLTESLECSWHSCTYIATNVCMASLVMIAAIVAMATSRARALQQSCIMPQLCCASACATARSMERKLTEAPSALMLLATF